MAKILVLNGPNLNMLAKREPGLYGSLTLDQIIANLEAKAKQAGHELETLQSNSEQVLIERIHACYDQAIDFIIFNPASFSHTSIGLRDALLAVGTPFIEVHISNVYQREAFRHHSYFSDIAQGVIIGLGPLGYEVALYAVIQKLSART
ncbi:MAG: type II 3-dehydroquinate dehydratase [Gammaproteobacteria bacterium]|nr:type II 3-dehydroquinate dehydratase [Gammaproteobacteria bacterium]MDH5728360.1 type II 3-dehydroquinate dehydratase [Gammaproteobacteria bacterium]